jgi:hypothetical protein
VEEDFKRWTGKRKVALVTEILQGKTSVSEVARSFDLSPSEIEDSVYTKNLTRSSLLRSDNGLVFTSKSFTALVRSYGLKQECITPHPTSQ